MKKTSKFCARFVLVLHSSTRSTSPALTPFLLPPILHSNRRNNNYIHNFSLSQSIVTTPFFLHERHFLLNTAITFPSQLSSLSLRQTYSLPSYLKVLFEQNTQDGGRTVMVSGVER